MAAEGQVEGETEAGEREPGRGAGEAGQESDAQPTVTKSLDEGKGPLDTSTQGTEPGGTKAEFNAMAYSKDDSSEQGGAGYIGRRTFEEKDKAVANGVILLV